MRTEVCFSSASKPRGRRCKNTTDVKIGLSAFCLPCPYCLHRPHPIVWLYSRLAYHPFNNLHILPQHDVPPFPLLHRITHMACMHCPHALSVCIAHVYCLHALHVLQDWPSPLCFPGGPQERGITCFYQYSGETHPREHMGRMRRMGSTGCIGVPLSSREKVSVYMCTPDVVI